MTSIAGEKCTASLAKMLAIAAESGWHRSDSTVRTPEEKGRKVGVPFVLSIIGGNWVEPFKDIALFKHTCVSPESGAHNVKQPGTVYNIGCGVEQPFGLKTLQIN